MTLLVLEIAVVRIPSSTAIIGSLLRPSMTACRPRRGNISNHNHSHHKQNQLAPLTHPPPTLDCLEGQSFGRLHPSVISSDPWIDLPNSSRQTAAEYLSL
ncbi:hypothetical protein BJX96DRAFT_110222 [Aspergillus floccosus]